MSMAGSEPRGDATLRGFARQIAKLQRDLRILEVTSQGAYRSVEEGSVDFYDEDGVLRERVGKQKDGSYGRVTVDGPVPPTPSEPDVVVIDNGVVAITWDGRTDEKWPTSEFRMVRVHLGDTTDFTPTRGNQVGAIHAQRGGTIVAVTESDDDNPVYVRLVAVSRAGHTSDPSDAVLVDELDEDGLADEDDELEWEDGDGHTLTVGDIDAGTVTFGLSHIPEQESLIAFLGGVHQKSSNYTVDYDGPSVTWPLAGWEPEGARISVQYPYYSGALAGQMVATGQGNGAVVMPDGVQDGDLVVVSAAVPNARAVSSANGYTIDVTTASVAHVAHYGTYNYRLISLSRVLSSGATPVPTFTAGADDIIWVVTVWRGPTLVTAEAHGTVADAKTADTPALSPGHVRAWVALGDMPTISLLDPGTVAAASPGLADLAIMVAVDAGDGAVTAETAAPSAGWMVATLSLEGGVG